MYQIGQGKDNIELELDDEPLRIWEAKKALRASGHVHIYPSERISKCINCQVLKVLKHGQKAKRKGGRCFKKLCEDWNAKPYQLRVFIRECIVRELKMENDALRQENHLLEDSLCTAESKVRKLANETCV